ncbi:hypothetical protein RHGRI_023878 [Rhododendron griersonianum]|uniref:Uncharacterized protein n=1 Tax=Rhododendron griersonianum TaxID=479676 RepID=A0AAV6J728_9ERIC|nr:hypothetical protein RHGRI_023878 [Rhododendron griersonianum]
MTLSLVGFRHVDGRSSHRNGAEAQGELRRKDRVRDEHNYEVLQEVFNKLKITKYLLSPTNKLVENEDSDLEHFSIHVKRSCLDVVYGMYKKLSLHFFLCSSSVSILMELLTVARCSLRKVLS